MIRDFASFDSDQPITCDLCVAGAGAVGIALALEFAGSGQRVVVIESGGLVVEEATQDLYDGRNIGHPYFELEAIRIRCFGGSTNHWGGLCAPLDPSDFEKRDWMPYSGWPITAAELQPYYVRAHSLMQLGPFNYDLSSSVPPGIEFLDFRPDRVRPKLWRYSAPPMNFGIVYRDAVGRAPGVDVLLHANLVEIETNEAASQVTAYRITTLDGKTARVQARIYVLALGGLENPRLLLSSNRVVSAGLGNQRDLVGRFFMEHIRIEAANVLSDKHGWQQAYGDLTVGDRRVRCALTVPPEIQARQHISNPMLMIGRKNVTRVRSRGYASLSDLRNSLAEGEVPEHLGQDLLNIIDDLDGIVRSIYERVDSNTYLVTEAEQAPNPDSRVTLGTERDRLGLRRINLDWRLSPLDKRSARTLAQLVGQEFARLGIGRLQMEDWLVRDDTTWIDEVSGHYHHMGTTRMASDPSQGVVDADCRVFGINNFYIGGSSVFPTGGCANPTLSLTALALRLADHLKTALA